jgi:hypothetical protein
LVRAVELSQSAGPPAFAAFTKDCNERYLDVLIRLRGSAKSLAIPYRRTIAMSVNFRGFCGIYSEAWLLRPGGAFICSSGIKANNPSVDLVFIGWRESVKWTAEGFGVLGVC